MGDFLSVVILTSVLTLGVVGKSVSKPGLLGDIDKHIATFTEKVSKAKDQAERLQLLKSLEADLVKLRSHSEPTIEEDGHYSQLLVGLKLIPRSKTFNVKVCESARGEILSKLEPKFEFEAKQPATIRTLDILRLVGNCPVDVR